jgi:hypothetical protein
MRLRYVVAEASRSRSEENPADLGFVLVHTSDEKGHVLNERGLFVLLEN